jgi:hypothetical protein
MAAEGGRSQNECRVYQAAAGGDLQPPLRRGAARQGAEWLKARHGRVARHWLDEARQGKERQGNSIMKTSIIGLLFAAAFLAIIPISPQVTPRGIELKVDAAQAYYGHARRVTRRVARRTYRRGYYGGAYRGHYGGAYYGAAPRYGCRCY